MNSWPDGGMTPFRSEKDTNWEGAFRIPLIVRWPDKIKAGSISNDIIQHHDWLPTFLAMAGDPDVVDKLKAGYQAIGRTYKNHIDGFNLLPYLTGEVKESPRKLFMYISDDGDILGLRYDNWKVVFMEQRCHGTLQVWAEPFTRLRCRSYLTFGPIPTSWRTYLEHLLRLVFVSRLYPVWGICPRRQIRGDVQRFPDCSEAEQLHARRCDQDDALNRLRRTLSVASGRPGHATHVANPGCPSTSER